MKEKVGHFSIGAIKCITRLSRKAQRSDPGVFNASRTRDKGGFSRRSAQLEDDRRMGNGGTARVWSPLGLADNRSNRLRQFSKDFIPRAPDANFDRARCSISNWRLSNDNPRETPLDLWNRLPPTRLVGVARAPSRIWALFIFPGEIARIKNDNVSYFAIFIIRAEAAAWAGCCAS